MFSGLLRYGAFATGGTAAVYATFIALLTIPWIQAHVLYLHAVQMTWGKDLSKPEQFGFVRNQVTPFEILSKSGQSLYAWHVLPLNLYYKHETELLAQSAGLVSDVSSRLSFKLLRSDPEARLVIHFHGAGGTVASGHRCPNYRALSAADPEHTHVLTFDYRGFGNSPGSPSEVGVIEDATTVVEWAIDQAGIPPSRILIYSQSLGTAVNIAVAEQFAKRAEPIFFAGHILTAPFVDVATLLSTYSIAGTIPLLGPVARVPALFNFLRTLVWESWSTKESIVSLISSAERAKKRYYINILHAQDDWDIPWTHSLQLTHRATNAIRNTTLDEVEKLRRESRSRRTDNSSVLEIESQFGLIREDIIEYGLHDVIMGSPTVSLAVKRAFDYIAPMRG